MMYISSWKITLLVALSNIHQHMISYIIDCTVFCSSIPLTYHHIHTNNSQQFSCDCSDDFYKQMRSCIGCTVFCPGHSAQAYPAYLSSSPPHNHQWMPYSYVDYIFFDQTSSSNCVLIIPRLPFQQEDTDSCENVPTFGKADVTKISDVNC